MILIKNFLKENQSFLIISDEIVVNIYNFTERSKNIGI